MRNQAADIEPGSLREMALHAIRAGRHEQAIDLLIQASAVAPDNGELLYLLAAEYAQTGLTMRACELMARAIELAPDLHIARLQLGMLLLSSGNAALGVEVLSPLMTLLPDDWLGYFAKGLVHLCQDEFAECRQMLERGISVNHANPALNSDMEKILASIASVDSGMAGRSSPSATISRSIWMAAYQADPDLPGH
jgi:Flp pilus assembly protein TadD